MRFSVRCLDVCAGEKKRTLRKSAFCEAEVTEKRILGGWGHEWRHNASARRTKSEGERASARAVGAMSERAKASSSRDRSKPPADKELRIVFLRWAKDASMT